MSNLSTTPIRSRYTPLSGLISDTEGPRIISGQESYEPQQLGGPLPTTAAITYAPPTPVANTGVEFRRPPRLNLVENPQGPNMAEDRREYGEFPPEEDLDGQAEEMVSHGVLAQALSAMATMQAETSRRIHQDMLIAMGNFATAKAREVGPSDRRGVLVPPPEKFNGEGLREWVRCMESYLTDNGVPPDKWCILASAHLTGEAKAHWAACRDNQHESIPQSWHEMIKEFHRRFCAIPPSEIREMLRNIGWEGSISKLSSRFNEVLAKGDTPPQREIVDIYLGRLPVELAMAAKNKIVDSWSGLQQLMMREDNSTRTLLQRWKSEALPEHLKTAEALNTYWKPMLGGGRNRFPGGFTPEEGRRYPPKQQAVAQYREGDSSRGGSTPPYKGGGAKNPGKPQNPSSEQCSICKGVGHGAKGCANQNDIQKRDSNCNKCGGYGHWARDCSTRGRTPNIKREPGLNDEARGERGNPSGNATRT